MITIGQIAQNLKKGQSAIKVKYIIQGLDQYAEKMMSVIRIDYAKVEGNGTLVFYKVPSETTKTNVEYDVVIWYNSKGRINGSTGVKIYSNSPGFGYNFAYVFNKEQSLLFPSRYPTVIVSRPPNVRNPYEAYTFDKHVYACMKKTTKYNLSEVVKHFEAQQPPKLKTFEQKQQEVNQLREELREQKLRNSQRPKKK